MKKLLKNALLVGLVSIPTLFGKTQQVHTQSLHDSLRQMLTHIEEKTKNDILKNVVKEAKTLYKSNVINDSLAKKLLIADSLLVNATLPDKPVALSYTTTLVQLFRLLPSGQEHLNYASSLSNLAHLYFVMGEYDKALHLYEQALAIGRKTSGKEHPFCATTLNALANLYLYIGKYDKALPLFEQALAIRKKVFGEEHPEYATILNRLAFLYFSTGHYDKALHLYDQALAIRKKTSGEDHPDYSNSLNNRGFLYVKIGQYDKALPLYEHALAVRKKTSGEENNEYAVILHRLAFLYFTTGHYEKALPLFQEALAIREKTAGKEHAEYAITLDNLTLLYVAMGQYDKALPLFRQTLAIRKKTIGEMHPLYAHNLNYLANLYYAIGHYEKALPLLQRSAAIRKKVIGENHPDYAYGLNSLALVYFAIGQYNKALPLYKQALAIRKKTLGEMHPDYANSLNSLANLYSTTGLYEKALPLFRQSLAIRQKVLGEEHPDYVTCLNSLANLYSESGNFIDASALFTAASHSTLRHLNQTYATLSEHEKMKLFKIRASHFEFLPSLLSTQSEQPSLVKQVYANELALKGMVLEDQQEVLNSIRKSGDSTALQLYEQWRLNKTFLGRQLLLPIARRIPNLDSLQEVTNQLEQQLSRRTASFRNVQRSQAITSNDIAQKLQKGQAAVEFISFRLYDKGWTDRTMYAALVLLPAESTPHFITLFEEKQLQNLFKSSAKKVNAVAAIQKFYGGDSLYQLIWKPLEKYFTGVRTVHYAPAGLLHRIAFQALQIDSGHLLINDYQLNQVLSTRTVALPLQVNKKPGSAAIWANIQYGFDAEAIASRGSEESSYEMDSTASSFNFYTWDTREIRGKEKEWRPLTGTKQEMESITKELLQAGTTTAIDSGTVATEEAFKALDGRSPEVLHMATHGFFLPEVEIKPHDNGAGNNVFIVQQNPMFRSGLVLAGANHAWKGGAAIAGKEDGILTAYEIAQMDLSNTDLVVLSACETGRGDLQGNEGVIGLQRAFKMAGVKQLIVSLWRVPDKETAELMKLFYGNWLSGQSTREALRSAQLKMKEKYPSPYYWAAFVLME